MSPDRVEAASVGDTREVLLDSEDIPTFLQEFAAVIAERLSDGHRTVWCAVSLLRERTAGTAASSSPQADALDELQNRFSDGPCLAAMRERAVIRVGDVRDDQRWPDYHAAAAQQGVRSVLGVPFELHGEARAALNVYSTRPHDFDPDLVETVRQEVRDASGALRLAVRLARLQDAQHDLQAALASRTVIDLAVGIIMGQNRCSQEEAVDILKTASNHRNLKVRDIAAALVAGLDPRSPSTHFEL